MATKQMIALLFGGVCMWTVVFLAALGVSSLLEPASVPRVAYGAAVIEGARELVECEFDEPLTVIVSIMNYYDDYDELNLDHLTLTGDDTEVWGWTNCEWQPEHNVALCDVYTLLPTYVRDDPVLDTIGHEQTHGSCGDFHE